MQVGIFSVGDLWPDPVGGHRPGEEERLLGLVRIAERAEAVGLDVFAIGEHHAPGHVPSSPPVLLAHIAARTSRLILSTSAAILPISDPVRLAEDYALVQQLAGGRFDLMAGRGHEKLAYDAFGFPVPERAEIFTENLELLRRLWSGEPVDWSGTWRRGRLCRFTSVPRPWRDRAPFVWLASTNSVETARLAAEQGYGLFVNNIFQTFEWYGSLVEAYREALPDPRNGVLGVGAHVFIHERSQEAMNAFRPFFGGHPIFGSLPLEEYCVRTALTVGSPAQVVERTLELREHYGHYQRQLYLVDFAGVPLDVALRQVEFVGEIADTLRSEFDRSRPAGSLADPPPRGGLGEGGGLTPARGPG